MKKHIVNKVVVVLSVAFIVISIVCGVVFFLLYESVDTSATREITGTVTKIILPESSSGSASIYTEEHDNYWIIDFAAYRYVDVERLETLSEGDEIVIGISADDFETYSDSLYTGIVYLESDKGVILSHEDYANGLKYGLTYVLYVCVFTCGVSVIGFVLSFKSLKKFKRKECSSECEAFLKSMKKK